MIVSIGSSAPFRARCGHFRYCSDCYRIGAPQYLSRRAQQETHRTVAVGMQVTSHPPQSGRVEARTGLR